MYFVHFCCADCGRIFDDNRWLQECDCGSSLTAVYDLDALERFVQRRDLLQRPFNIWRYHELLPIQDRASQITLGEGSTPLVPLKRIARSMGLDQLLLKDEGRNPTGTFKDRGAAVGLSAAKKHSVSEIVVPTIGSAGAAWSAYGAAVGIRVHVAMPAAMPPIFESVCRKYGAEVEVFDGDFSVESAARHQRALDQGWASAATLREPYRLEGKKTLLFEIVEQSDWRVPDVVICPTGGGVAAIAVWKAYHELVALRWVADKPMRIVAVQAAGVAPIVRAWDAKQTSVERWEKVTTTVPGFMASKPRGGPACLKALYESEGFAIALDDSVMFDMSRRLARDEGLDVSPEGSAAVAAAGALRESGFIREHDHVVAINTATGLRYPAR